jgi:hypothetical protein
MWVCGILIFGCIKGSKKCTKGWIIVILGIFSMDYLNKTYLRNYGNPELSC